MAPRPRHDRRHSLAKRSQVRYSGTGSFARTPIRGESTRKRPILPPLDTNLATIGSIPEARSSTTTIASTIKALSFRTTRSRASTAASFLSSSRSGSTTNDPSGPTREEKAARKRATKAARRENPNADPNFAHLPKGLNNKIRNKDPLKAKLKRLLNPKKKVVHKPLDRSQPVATPRLGYRLDCPSPAPARYIPPIAPARQLGQKVDLDKTGASLGGEFQALAETEEERERRIERAKLQHDLRRATDFRLRLEGREQINDRLIGRAPPITRRALREPIIQRQTRENRSDSTVSNVPTTPSTIYEDSPLELLPEEQAGSHMVDHAFETIQQSPNLHDSTLTSVGSSTGETTPYSALSSYSSAEALACKPSKLSNLSSYKKPRRKLSVTFAPSVESIIIPCTDYDTSDVTQLAYNDTAGRVVATGAATESIYSPSCQVDSTDFLVHGTLAIEHPRLRTKRSAIHDEYGLQELFVNELREGENVEKQKRDNSSQGNFVVSQKHDTKSIESPEGTVQVHLDTPRTWDDTSTARFSEDNIKEEDSARRESSLLRHNFPNQTSSTDDFLPASYDTITNYLLVSNTPPPPPPIPTKSPLRQLSQRELIPCITKVDLIINNLIRELNLLSIKHLSDLQKLKEAHVERMNYLKRKKKEHRERYGALQAHPSQDLPAKPTRRQLRSRLSRFFKKEEATTGTEEGSEQVSEGDLQGDQEVSENEHVPDNVVTSFARGNPNHPYLAGRIHQSHSYPSTNNSNSSISLHPDSEQEYITDGEEIQEELLNDTVTQGESNDENATRIDDTLEPISEHNDTPKDQVLIKTPWFKNLTPSHREYFYYEYKTPNSEDLAALSTGANAQRQRKAFEDSKKANEATHLAYEGVVKSFEESEAEKKKEASNNLIGRASHVTTLGAVPLSKQERGSGFPLASTSSTSSYRNNHFGGSFNLHERKTSFGFKNQTSSPLSPQIPKAAESQKLGAKSLSSSKQQPTPQQINKPVPNRQSQRFSSNSTSSGRSYSREEQSKWINSDTLAEHEDSDPGGIYSAYFRGAIPEKLSKKKLSIDQEAALKEDAQVAANLQRAEARRAERRGEQKALQESQAAQLQVQAAEDCKQEKENQARFERSLSSRPPDPDPDPDRIQSSNLSQITKKLQTPTAATFGFARGLPAPTSLTSRSARLLQAPTALNPAREFQTLAVVDHPAEPQVLTVTNSVERDRLRVNRLQSNRNISTGSPVSRGSHTFGFDSLLNAPQGNSSTLISRSQLPQPENSPRELQGPSPSGLRSPQNRSQDSSPTTEEPLISSRLRQPSTVRQITPVPHNLPIPSAAGRQSPSIPRISAQATAPTGRNPSGSRLPVPGINVRSGTLPPNQQSFLDVSLIALGAHFAEMDKLQVRTSEPVSVKTKAIEDARQMQASVIEAATKSGKEPPKYALVELIGKGSFGRVYKGKDMVSAAIVAVKIIDIEESDTINPTNANSYAEFLKEITALKTLSENKARNINHVIEALPVGQAMWMITEYCGGGSVATLMKPTAPGGLQEKWIIPILREVAEAIKWVHEAGIIHRDIKCANVLITEEGAVQLCDFGVAGTMETKVDKRSTVIGTPHWMAPELFDVVPSYGKEVDIWAFGCMVYEIATGLPPNAMSRLPFDRLGSLIKQHAPRLEGGDYSDDLRDLVAFCLEEFPSERPPIERVQNHRYLLNTSSRYPMSSLSHLVRAFKLWEDHGGSRKSLFMLGGAQAPSEFSSTALSDDEWNFSTTAAFEQDVRRKSTAQDVYDVYGSGVEFDAGFPQETARPPPQKGRRRPPPEALAPLRGPLEKIFDPNTLSSYEDNVRNHYGRPFQPSTSDLPPVPSRSDLPLRDDTAQTSIRDTMIDLGGHDVETGISVFPDMDTIKAGRRVREEPDEDYMTTLPDFSRPALSDPADINPNRRTQDWKFPSMAPPASADPEVSRFPPSTYEVPKPAITPGLGGRPPLIHHPTEPLGGFSGGLPPAEIHTGMARLSVRESLIDLDMSMPDPIPAFNPEFRRPSTADSDVISLLSDSGQALTSSTVNPFELERHASLYQPTSHEREPSIYAPSHEREPSIFVPSHEREPSIYAPSHERELSIYATSHEREPSIYVTEELGSLSASATPPRPESTSRPLRADRPPRLRTGSALRDIADSSDFSDSAAESTLEYNTDANDTDSDYATVSTQPPPQSARPRDPNAPYTMAHFPNLPNAPSVRALTGEAAHEEMAFEMSRMLLGLTGQLEAFRDVYGSEDLARRSNQRRGRRDNGGNGV